ncbi:MAG: hypothetical protein ACI8TP_004540 [Acidimicrobiales bacterium]|jgi:hypothetical protein
MSTSVIFIVGVIVFAVTVYGAVMAGGLALTRIVIEQNPDLKKKLDEDELKKRFAFRGKY